MKYLLIGLLAIVGLTSCSENFANGERIGLVTQFSKAGIFWKSWEGHLNLTQTGMNSSSSVPFDFSVDNDREDTAVISRIDSAARFGWKVRLTYHETRGKNWFSNRGETNHFITAVEILEKDPVGHIFNSQRTDSAYGKGVRDTIYLIIYRDKK